MAGRTAEEQASDPCCTPAEHRLRCAAGCTRRCDFCHGEYCPSHIVPPLSSEELLAEGGHFCPPAAEEGGFYLECDSSVLFDRRQAAREWEQELEPVLRTRMVQSSFRQVKLHPKHWGITLGQLLQFQREIGSGRGRTMRDIVDQEVKPRTAGKGMGLGLLLNSESPLTADFMISHAWNEDFDEFVDNLNSMSVLANRPQTVLWICSFGLYQSADAHGPSIAEQVGADAAVSPFRCVLLAESTRGMIIVHNSNIDIYSRLWCVYELFLARSLGMFIYPSQGDEGRNPDDVNCEDAFCFDPNDRRSILEGIEMHGGIHEVNAAVKAVRRNMRGAAKRAGPAAKRAGPRRGRGWPRRWPKLQAWLGHGFP